MPRISWSLASILFFLVHLPGLNLFISQSFALEHSNQIKGKVIVAESKASVEFANVSLVHLPDSVPVQITATDIKGEFGFVNLMIGNYAIVVHFMGFKNYISLPITLSEKESTIKLEPISMENENVALGEVSITKKSGKPVYQLDKKTIYVEDQLSGAGGSASDLLHKLPSVTQGPDGSIAIHGNSKLLVFINGKPSSLKGDELLQNTSAAEIKKIELITSPSAKYDASGSGGIINLITKKNSLQGFNGNIQAAADHLGGYSSDVLLNYKYHDFSFFGGIDHNMRRNQGDVDHVIDYLNDQSQLRKSGIQKAERINTGFRTGFDYLPSAANRLSVNGNGGSLNINNNGDWLTASTNPVQSTSGRNESTDDNQRNGHYGGADVSYEHKFDSLKKSISFSALWNTLNYDDNYLNLISNLSGMEQMRQATVLNKDRNNYQFNTDFTSPAGKSGYLEFGYQISLNNESETYLSTKSIPLPLVRTNQETQFNEIIQAGYGTWQYKGKKLDIKAGLRAENLDRTLTTINNKYPLQHFDLYPTLNSSFKIDSIQEIMFNYSRRTDQLKSTQLDPLPRWYDFYNVMMGNPDLRNEITDKLAINYLLNFSHLTLNNEIYYFNTADKIEVIRSLYHDGIIQNRYENTGTEKTLGIEFNADWTTTSWLSLNEKVDFIESNLGVRLDDFSQQKSYRQWYSVTTADISLSPSTMLQLDFSYYSPAMTAQSHIDQFFMAGISFRQSFFDKRLNFTLTGRDFLGLYQNFEHIEGEDFNQKITTQNKFPIRFSLSYKFNRYKRDDRRIAKTPLME
ncbi:MAG: TonB-dependent receptor family protein [Prolixibacteraceae bacterium]